jgi:enoyl-CoA hydratase
VAAQDAVFGVFCRRFGVPLIDLGTVRLPRLIGQSRAMDLILTGRPVDANEALQIGLANRLAPSGGALEAALALARQLSAFPQACMRNDRASALDQWSLDWDAATRREAELGLISLRTGDHRQGAQRFTGGQGRHGAF